MTVPTRKTDVAAVNKVGHIDAVCPYLVVKDWAGRQSTVAESRPSGTQVSTRQDSTNLDHMNSAKSFLRHLREMTVKKRQKAKESRSRARGGRKRKDRTGSNLNPSATNVVSSDGARSGHVDRAELRAHHHGGVWRLSIQSGNHSRSTDG